MNNKTPGMQLSVASNLLVIFLLFSLSYGRSGPAVRNVGGSQPSKEGPEKAGTDIWTQFRGQARSGVSAAQYDLKIWNSDGPKLVWKHTIGDGFSGIVITGTVLVTAFAVDSTEYLAGYDSRSGRENWRVEIGKMFIDNFGNGPRSTPVFDNGRAFVLASRGRISAVDADAGEILWTVSLADSFEIKVPDRGFTTSLLVQDDLVIVHAGGGEGEAIVALDKNTGRLVWKIGDSAPSYSSPFVATINGVKQNIFAATRIAEIDGSPQNISEVISVSTDGKILWKAPSLPLVIAMPVFMGPDRVFVSGSREDGCLAFRVVQDADTTRIEPLWKSKEMKNHFSSSVYYKNHIYGFSKSTLKCLEAATGERKWRKRGFGKGSIIIVDDKLVVLDDRGRLAIIEATADGYHELAYAQALDGKSWTSPTFVGGKIYLRNRKEMACYDLTN